MKTEMIEMTETEMQNVIGGDWSDFGGILAAAGMAAVGGAFVLVAAPALLVTLAVVGSAAVVEGAYIAATN